MTVFILSGNSLFSQPDNDNVTVLNVVFVSIGDVDRNYDGSVAEFKSDIEWEEPMEVEYEVVMDFENDCIVFDNQAESTYYIDDIISTDEFTAENGNVIKNYICTAYDEEDIYCSFTIYYDITNKSYTFMAEYSDMAIAWTTHSYQTANTTLL